MRNEHLKKESVAKATDLLTEELLEKFKASEIDAGCNKSTPVLVKYFNPYGAGTWLITEAEPLEDGDWCLFGYCHILEWEWGTVLLSELQEVVIHLAGQLPVGLERDLYVGENPTIGSLCPLYEEDEEEEAI